MSLERKLLDTSSLQATYTRQELPVSEYGRSAISFTRLSMSMVVTSSGMGTGSPILIASVTWVKSGSGGG